MKLFTEMPVHITFMGHDLYIDRQDFELAQRFRQEGIDDFNSNSCWYVNNQLYRFGYYTIQHPTKLIPGSELCPTFVISHVDDNVLKKLNLNRDTLAEVWRSPESNEPLIGYAI